MLRMLRMDWKPGRNMVWNHARQIRSSSRERDLIEQSLLTMEAEIVTHLADVTGLPRNQRCRKHTNHDHPYECTECANVLKGVNEMLENNKDQIMRCKNLRAESTIITNAEERADHLTDMYDCEDNLPPIPKIWKMLCPNRMFTQLDRQLATIVHQSDLTRFLGTHPEAPKTVKWVPCRIHHSGKLCRSENCPYAHTKEDYFNSWNARIECEKGPVGAELIYYHGTRFVRNRAKVLDIHEAAPDAGDSDEDEIPECESFREENREPRRNRHYDKEVIKPVQQQAAIVHTTDNWLCHVPDLKKDGTVTKVDAQGERACV